MSTENTTEATATVHPFEHVGLGKAPFRYVGVEYQDRCYGQVILNRAEYEQTGIALTTQPGGTCAFCGTFILNMYNVTSADGQRFHVGSDCAEKIAPHDPKLGAKIAAAAKKAVSAQAVARTKRTLAGVEAALVDETTREQLAALPHPTAWRAEAGDTLLDWAEWMLANAGAAGKTKVARAIRLATAAKAAA